MQRSRVTAGLVSATLVGGLAGGLVACGGGDDRPSGPDPRSAATALASALAAGDLGTAPFTTSTATAAQSAYGPIVAGMGEVKPVVTVASVDATATSAKATLRWTWDLGGGATWTYDDPVTFRLSGTGSDAGSDAAGVWQAAWSPALVEPSLTTGQRLETSSITAARGEITGAGGLALVASRPVNQVGLDKTQLAGADAGTSARALAALVGVDPDAFATQVAAAGDQAFVQAIEFRQDETPVGVANQISTIPGARIIATYADLAPTKDFATPILGRVGPVTAEMITADPTYRAGDVAGLSGLEQRYDSQLRGAPGVQVSAVKDDGASKELFRTDATAGTPVSTSLDLDAQSEAERLLADVKPSSALVAIKPSTGAILVAANGPGNDGQNVATYGRFAPGSTFKTATSLALLRSGLTPESSVPCTTSITVNGKVFTNDSEYPAGATGNIALRTALANSCNTAFISQAGRLQGSDLYDAGVSLGIGIDHDLGFPAFLGSTDPDQSQTGQAAQMIGQGTILASPMVMATVMATIQSGTLVVPHLVDGVDTSAPDGAEPVTATEDEQLKAMLRGAVTSGTGRGLLDVPGDPVIAKTGTAEFDQGAAGKRKTHAWMIAAQGDLAVAVFVNVGQTGSGTAGPILEQFLRWAQANGRE